MGVRRRWLIGLLWLGALVVVDSICWRIAADQLSKGADRWIVDARRQGWVVTEHARVVGGWPFAATLTIAAPELAGGNTLLPDGLRWSSGSLVLTVSAFHPEWLSIAALGRQQMRLSNLPDLTFSGTELATSIKLWGGGRAFARIDAASVSGDIAGSRHLQDFQVGSLHLRLTGVSESRSAGAWPSATLDIHADRIALPEDRHWPLGQMISHLSGTVALQSPAAGPVGSSDIESQAEAWRDGGGRLDAQDIRLHWGQLKLDATASLTLDKRLQPTGSGKAALVGSKETLAALSQAVFTPPGVAAMARAMLMFLPRAPDDADALQLPLVLRDNEVSVGQVPIITLKALNWR